MNSAESLEPQRGCRGGRWLDRAGAQRGSLDCRHTQLPKPWARGRPLTDLYVQKKEKRVQGMGPGGPRLKGYAEKNGSGSKETVSGKVGVISGERERELSQKTREEARWALNSIHLCFLFPCSRSASDIS